MLKSFIEKSLEAEMNAHLSNSTFKNKRNGKGKKILKTNIGSIEIETSADSNSNFEPTIGKKHQTILADNLSDKIIGLYGLGISLRIILNHIKKMHDMHISHTVLSEIT